MLYIKDPYLELNVLSFNLNQENEYFPKHTSMGIRNGNVSSMVYNTTYNIDLVIDSKNININILNNSMMKNLEMFLSDQLIYLLGCNIISLNIKHPHLIEMSLRSSYVEILKENSINIDWLKIQEREKIINNLLKE